MVVTPNIARLVYLWAMRLCYDLAYSTNPVKRLEVSLWSGSGLFFTEGSVLWPVSEAGLGQGWNQSESVSGSVCGHGCGQSEVTLL